jgi:hypothetical protein
LDQCEPVVLFVEEPATDGIEQRYAVPLSAASLVRSTVLAPLACAARVSWAWASVSSNRPDEAEMSATFSRRRRPKCRPV